MQVYTLENEDGHGCCICCILVIVDIDIDIEVEDDVDNDGDGERKAEQWNGMYGTSITATIINIDIRMDIADLIMGLFIFFLERDIVVID